MQIETNDTAVIEAAPETTKPAAKSKGKGKKKAAAPEGATLQQVFEGYFASMTAANASPGTLASYGMEARLAMGEIGADTLLSAITTEQVQAFFDCQKVTRLRNGKLKAPPSVAKSRRVLRLALCWAQTQGWCEKAPIPESL